MSDELQWQESMGWFVEPSTYQPNKPRPGSADLEYPQYGDVPKERLPAVGACNIPQPNPEIGIPGERIDMTQPSLVRGPEVEYFPPKKYEPVTELAVDPVNEYRSDEQQERRRGYEIGMEPLLTDAVLDAVQLLLDNLVDNNEGYHGMQATLLSVYLRSHLGRRGTYRNYPDWREVDADDTSVGD